MKQGIAKASMTLIEDKLIRVVKVEYDNSIKGERMAVVETLYSCFGEDLRIRQSGPNPREKGIKDGLIIAEIDYYDNLNIGD